MFLKLLASCLFAAMMPMSSLYACASCGSGGEDPLVLYPNETWKTYFGLAGSDQYRNVDQQGNLTHPGGAERRQTAIFSVGYGINTRSFVTLQNSYVRGIRGGQSRSGPGDPILSGRYSLVLPMMTEVWIPQLQIIGSYRPSFAPSIHSYKNRKLLDVRGSGFDEFRFGLDLWNGQHSIKYGAAYVVTYSKPERYRGVLYRPGLFQRTTITAGYGWSASSKTLVGVNREQRAPIRYGEQNTLSQLNHSLFLTQDIGFGDRDSVRLTLAKQAALGKNRNTYSARTMSLAWFHTW